MESERRWFLLPWPLPFPPLPLLLPLLPLPLLVPSPLGDQGIESARRRAAADTDVDESMPVAGPLIEWLARWWPRLLGPGGARLEAAGDVDEDGRRVRSGW